MHLFKVIFAFYLLMNITFTLQEIRQVAASVYEVGKNYTVWAIHGDMGAGKTTFIHALCEHLGVTSAIGSPTYSIINEYKGANNTILYHMDWYRLKDEEEALQAGVEECLFSGNLCLIEWPEIAKGLLPEDVFHLQIQMINTQERSISYAKME